MSKLSKNQKNPLIEEAWGKIEKGRLEEALELFDAALEENKKDADALYGRASANFLVEETEKSIQDLNSLLKIDVNNQKAYHLRGLIKGGDKKTSAAIKDLKKAVSLDESNIEAVVDLGGAYLVDKDYASARLAFEKVIKLHDECPDGWRGMGIALLFEKKYDKAIEMLEKALKKDPNDIDSILALADAYFALNENSKAKKLVKKAKEVKKDLFNKKKNSFGLDGDDDYEDDDNTEGGFLDSDFED